MSSDLQNQLRALPSVSDLLADPDCAALCSEFGEGLVKLELRTQLDRFREKIRSRQLAEAPSANRILAESRNAVIRTSTPEGRRAINATGILLHTGLGRAPLPVNAIEACRIFDGYSVLQTDLDTGKRCLRETRIERMLRELTGCDAATVVNNNAAATMILLHTLAAGREVIVSRGQLVEIGGSFRLPDVMAMSGATLRDIGCTNRTHLSDYEAAITDNTGAMIHVHTSNYRVRGFHSTPPARELVELGNRRGIPVIDDLGSGALVSLREYGLEEEPLVRDSIRAGAPAACFSGDKLIGGPQAGIIVGTSDIIKRVRKNPFARMFRVDKFTLAGLECALQHFLNGTYETNIPFYRMLARPVDTLREQASRLVNTLPESTTSSIEIVDAVAYVGSGSIPDQGVPSVAVRISPEQPAQTEPLARRLRLNIPSVFCRIHNDALYFDMRTVEKRDADDLSNVLSDSLRAGDDAS